MNTRLSVNEAGEWVMKVTPFGDEEPYEKVFSSQEEADAWRREAVTGQPPAPEPPADELTLVEDDETEDPPEGEPQEITEGDVGEMPEELLAGTPPDEPQA